MKHSQKNGSTGTSVNGKSVNSSPASARRKNGRGETKKNGQPDAPARFYGSALPGVKSAELSGNLIVLEGTDGSGRSTQISLLTEWLESQGFAVETMGLRRSALVGEDIDGLLAENSVTRMTLALMYSTDFFDQLERLFCPLCVRG